MGGYVENAQEEKQYLSDTVAFLKSEIERLDGLLSHRRNALKESEKQMWEDSVHFSNDFDRMVEANQYLTIVNNHKEVYERTKKQVERYRRMLESPYFGRFDFMEADAEDKEEIYIGLYNAIDPNTHYIYVYDWRAPVSSIFYQYELGKASYEAPYGVIAGEVTLKRQYKIEDSELKYFFDCNVKIDDEMLQEVLGKNTSAKMRQIVETLQREQDKIIRDTENEVLIVQGVAGGGKTSIALHRIAYLLYYGFNLDLNYQNIMIISPNHVFSKYIASVLPELGEENVRQITFEDYAIQILKKKMKVQTRSQQIIEYIAMQTKGEIQLKEQSIEFKGSMVYSGILDRLVDFYEHSRISFEDVYFDGQLVESGQKLKEFFLDNEINAPIASRLKRIENIILDKIQPLQKDRLKKIEQQVEEKGGHEFEVRSYSRLLLAKESKNLLDRLRRSTEVDYASIYKVLFKERGLLEKLAADLELPSDMQQIIEETKRSLEAGWIRYEDCAPMLYLKLKLEGCTEFSGVRQVVIDEAQDYSPIQYKVFDLMFKDANYTVLGDISQSIEKEGNPSLYDHIVGIFNKAKSVKLTLNKSYRSTAEINRFNQRLLNRKQEIVSFERHGEKPECISKEDISQVVDAMLDDIKMWSKQGFESIAIICKTEEEVDTLYQRMKSVCKIKKITTGDDEIEKGILILPAYMAKGLEFDAVLVHDVSKGNYTTELDRRLLYIACTRALHRLKLYAIGEKSDFVKERA